MCHRYQRGRLSTPFMTHYPLVIGVAPIGDEVGANTAEYEPGR